MIDNGDIANRIIKLNKKKQMILSKIADVDKQLEELVLMHLAIMLLIYYRN
jgi:hypothetical protein